VKRGFNPFNLVVQRFQSAKVRLESRFGLSAILKAAQILLQFERALFGQAVDHPIPVPMRHDKAFVFQVGEVLGYLDLGLIQQGLKMTHAERPLREQMQNPQPRSIAETLVNPYEIHLAVYCHRNIPSTEY
jgi:hypothetical protein